MYTGDIQCIYMELTYSVMILIDYPLDIIGTVIILLNGTVYINQARNACLSQGLHALLMYTSIHEKSGIRFGGVM